MYMLESDDKVRRNILKELYDLFEESPASRFNGREFVEELSEEFDKEEIIYNIDRMDGEHLNNKSSIGEQVSIVNIEAKGIEELYSQGHETILDDELRYDILEILYQKDRSNPGYAAASRGDLIEELDPDEDAIDQNIWYLKERRFIEADGAGGGLFYRRAKITDRGRKRYEQYVEDGVEIPRLSGRQFIRQASIGPDEADKAENLFRDFVEISQNEVIIIDPYARTPLYDLLKHVPSGVEIKVFTSKRVTNQDYESVVSQFKDRHKAIEVKDLSFDNWEFHDRYVIRDCEDAWAWGHSFHDAGDTQHTASELKPINRERVLSLFDKLWGQGEKIV